ncbi:hypothetical protein GW756_04680 [bacterium]|nr:hypothetical protein [bacterium]NCQ55676.1 hypothetical protein [Candidatus Parcubacteria bacterium]NCS67625.1 hypothetical protein [Candidatus Peregrinibacteria bacterium]NCS96639.1 hypothetical protein [bacterium]
MKYFLTLLALSATVIVFASTPDYKETKTEIEDEKKQRAEETASEIPFDTIPFKNDVTPGDVTEGQETGQFSTGLSRREGEPTLQERMRARELQFTASMLDQIAENRDMLTDATERATRHADGDESNGGLDILAQQEAADVEQHGPKAKESKPAFAESSSSTLNPAPHASSQQGDECMDAKGNAASLTIDPLAPTYENACEGDSLSEHADCTMASSKEINSESKGAGGNSTQVMQPTMEPDRQKLGDVTTANNQKTQNATCSTAPRLAESKMENVADLVQSDRRAFEQADLVGGRTSSALSYQPTPEQYVLKKALPWYQNLLAWVIPSSKAQGTTGTLRGQTNTTGRENELAQQDFDKFLSDLKSHPDMADEQEFANRVSQMMEDQNKIQRTVHELTTQFAENMEKIANLKKKPF